MSNHNATIRHARNAIDMIINGALRQIESEYADTSSPECKEAFNELIANIREELDCWDMDDAEAR